MASAIAIMIVILALGIIIDTMFTKAAPSSAAAVA